MGVRDGCAGPGPETIHLAICADDNYVPYVSVVIRSLGDVADPSLDYVVYFLHSGVGAENLSRVSLTGSANVRVVPVDVRSCSGYRDIASVEVSGSHLTLASFYRLLLPELLPDVDKVLYFDCDVLIRKDPSELYRLDLGSSLAAACPDYPAAFNVIAGPGYRDDLREIGLKDIAGYFNTGVLLLNLRAFREERLWPECLRKVPCAARHLCDQDVLNVVCAGRVVAVNPLWNACLVSPEGLVSAGVAWIVHYNGRRKPWDSVAMKEGRVWWEAAVRSAFGEAFVRRRAELESGTEVGLLKRLRDEARIGYRLAWGARRRKLRAEYVRLRDEFDSRVRYDCGCKVKSVVTCFRRALYLADRVFVPVHAGRAVARRVSVCGRTGILGDLWLRKHMIGDDTGENISDRNREYCEATLLYWLRRNMYRLDNPEYIGMMHYRRFLALDESAVARIPRTERDLDLVQVRVPRVLNRRRFAEFFGLTPENIERECGKYDMVLVEAAPRGDGPLFSVRDGYCDDRIRGVHVEDIDLCVRRAGEMFPCYREELERYYHGGYKVLYNLFIVRREIFDWAANFTFAVLEDVEPRIDVSGYAFHGKRTMAFLSELLMGFYVWRLSRIPGCRCRKALSVFVEDPVTCSFWSRIADDWRRLCKRVRIFRYELKCRSLFGEKGKKARERIDGWRKELELEGMFR